jgi:hypothetical protein
MQKRSRRFLLRGALGRGRRRRSKFKGVENLGCWPFLVLFLGKKFSHQMSKRNTTRILNSSSVNGLDEDDDDKQALEEYMGERNKRVRDESVLVRV